VCAGHVIEVVSPSFNSSTLDAREMRLVGLL
jgi:hypothetical protein